eukprot:jgi/Mesvir1/24595/Mv21914-RA.2
MERSVHSRNLVVKSTSGEAPRVRSRRGPVLKASLLASLAVTIGLIAVSLTHQHLLGQHAPEATPAKSSVVLLPRTLQGKRDAVASLILSTSREEAPDELRSASEDEAQMGVSAVASAQGNPLISGTSVVPGVQSMPPARRVIYMGSLSGTQPATEHHHPSHAHVQGIQHSLSSRAVHAPGTGHGALQGGAMAASHHLHFVGPAQHQDTASHTPAQGGAEAALPLHTTQLAGRVGQGHVAGGRAGVHMTAGSMPVGDALAATGRAGADKGGVHMARAQAPPAQGVGAAHTAPHHGPSGHAVLLGGAGRLQRVPVLQQAHPHLAAGVWRHSNASVLVHAHANTAGRMPIMHAPHVTGGHAVGGHGLGGQGVGVHGPMGEGSRVADTQTLDASRDAAHGAMAGGGQHAHAHTLGHTHVWPPAGPLQHPHGGAPGGQATAAQGGEGGGQHVLAGHAAGNYHAAHAGSGRSDGDGGGGGGGDAAPSGGTSLPKCGGGPLPTSRWRHQPNHAYKREKSHGGFVIPIIDRKKVRVETENGRRPRGSYEPRVAKSVLPHEKPLVECLHDLRKCDQAAMEAARKVRGMREARNGVLKLFKDRWRTCAIVGNSGAMLHGDYGSYIDAHDVVVRINILPTDKIRKHVGTKTTHRVLSNKVAREVCCERRYVPDNDHVAFLMWFPAGRELLLERMRHHWPTHPAIYMHGPFLSSVVGVFKTFRVELQRLGFGPFDSWEFLTSGTCWLPGVMVRCMCPS